MRYAKASRDARSFTPGSAGSWGIHSKRGLATPNDGSGATNGSTRKPLAPGGHAGRLVPTRPSWGWSPTTLVQELGAVVVAAHPQVGAPIELHGVEVVGCRRRAGRRIDDRGVAEDDRHLPGIHRAAADQTSLLVVGGGEDQWSWLCLMSGSLTTGSIARRRVRIDRQSAATVARLDRDISGSARHRASPCTTDWCADPSCRWTPLPRR